ncbi:MAG: HAD-IA family hydrolase [Paracoccaceae bacterium]|nr:HAD-IA family hydrolase [Paracoccaceae bacterium]
MAREVMSNLNFSGIDVVSFDIFDTLLHRLVLAPVDVFELVRLRAFEDSRSLLSHAVLDNFSTDRVAAEAKARSVRVAEHGGEGEITLDEIYAQWQLETGAQAELADWLKGMELECEAHLLHASVKGKAVYDAARKAGCRILLLSDMYLPSDFLRKKLVDEGFDEVSAYPLYVSGEERRSKHMGTLYGHVAKAEALQLGPHWLHVGDNLHADVTKAQEAGLKCHHATWAKIRNVPTVRPNAYGSGNLLASLMAALKEPHARSRIPDNPMERIGYQVWGPMLFGFSCWLLSHFKNARIEHAIFVARDGYLLQQLFETCAARLPDTGLTSEYLYMSRKTGYKTGVRDWHFERTWYYVAGKSNMSTRKIFAVAGINAEDYRDVLSSYGITDIDLVLTAELKSRAVHALNTIHMAVLQRTAENRRNLSKFYDETMAGKKRVALVDIGWVGNIQRCFLHSLRDPIASTRLSGYYLGLHRDHIRLNAELGMSMQGYLNISDKYEELNKALLNGGVELLEFVLTAPHGSTIDLSLDDTGSISPVLEPVDEQEKAYQALAGRAQAGVKRFVNDYAFLLDWLSPDTLANPVWADSFLDLVMDPDQEALDNLAIITHSDGPGTNAYRLTLAPKLPPYSASNQAAWKAAREAAFWKAAFDKLNPEPIAPWTIRPSD